MNRISFRLVRFLACAAAMWGVARIVFQVAPGEDQTAAMVLLLCVLAVATLADRILAVTASLAASLSFSYFFINPIYTFRIETTKDAITFGVFIVVALTGSHLSIRARRRAEEIERRRGEMARLQQLGAALIAPGSLRDTAEKTVHEVVRLFGGGATLSIGGIEAPFSCGDLSAESGGPLTVQTAIQRTTLELHGIHPSVEVRSALVNLIGILLDRAVAEEERTRIEATRRGEELRTTILDALAHNFRTPLTCIKAAASMMRGSPDEPGSYSQELVEVIDEEADRLNELLRDSMDMAKIQARQLEPRTEDCAITSIVASVVAKMKRYLASHSVSIDIPDDLPAIRGDRFLYEQMITQVLDNAWKYGTAGSRIEISARQVENEIILIIRNEGAQIPDSEKALVFERFYRGNRTRASVEGTGLGLALAKTIAEAHGGRVWLETEADGPAFQFAIPVGQASGDEMKVEDHDREPHYLAD